MLAPALAVAVKAVATQKLKSASTLRRWEGHASVVVSCEGMESMFRAGGQRLRGAVGVIIARVEEVCRSAADGSECCGHRQEEGRELCETVVCKREYPPAWLATTEPRRASLAVSLTDCCQPGRAARRDCTKKSIKGWRRAGAAGQQQQQHNGAGQRAAAAPRPELGPVP